MIDAKHYSVGIDPGVSGGICILSPSRKIVAITSMPDTELGMWMWMNKHRYNFAADESFIRWKACIEKIGGYIPGDRSGKDPMFGEITRVKQKGGEFGPIQHTNVGDKSDKGDRGSHMFVMGRTYGALCMSMMACDLYPFREIIPRVWQKTLSIFPRDKRGERGEPETQNDFKRRLKQRALQLYPNDHKLITLSTCDALLIAYFCSL